jgi:hypothetical protein
MDGRRPTYDELLVENAALRKRVAELESLNAERESRNGEREGQVARFTARVELLLKRQEELRQRLEEKERSSKRQAAPFSKGLPKPDPKTPRSQVGRRLRTPSSSRHPRTAAG